MSPTYFTDHDLGRFVFPDILRSAEIRVETHFDHFGARAVPDVEWLAFVGEQRWVAVSRNKRIRYRSAERDMVMRSGVSLLLLCGKQQTHELMARNFVNTLPKIQELLSLAAPPVIVKVLRPSWRDYEQGRPGSVTTWLTERQWLEAKKSAGS